MDELQLMDRFSDTVAAVGSTAFSARLLQSLNHVMPVDHCTAVFVDDDLSASLVVCASRRDAQLFEDITASYIGGFIKLDPIVRDVRQARAADGMTVRSFARERLPSREYYQRFYELPAIVDKLSLAAANDGRICFLNLYNTRETGPFGADSARILSQVGRFVTHLIDLHYRVGRVHPALPPVQAVLAEKTAADASRTSLLSEREREICHLACQGLSAKEIARRLGIAPSSVVTYKQRIYQKLGIRRQYELLAIMAADKSARQVRPAE